MAKKSDRPTHYSTYGTIEKSPQFNPINLQLIEEYLSYCISQGLSSESIKQYKNKVEIFFVWLLENRNNKSYIDVTVQDIMIWQAEEVKAGKSSSTIRQIRSAVSGMSKYIENIYDKEYPSFRNVWKRLPAPKQEYIRAKTYLPESEFILLIKALIEREEWQKLAYLTLSYDAAGRKTEVWLASKYIDWERKETNVVRGKGGKTFSLPFSKETSVYLQKWIETRGEDNCDKLFIIKTADGKVKPISKQTLNNWCEYFSALYKELTGKDEWIYPHCFKANRLSNLYHEGHKSLELIQQFGHHNSSETTMKNYIQHKDSEVNKSIFDEE